MFFSFKAISFSVVCFPLELLDDSSAYVSLHSTGVDRERLEQGCCMNVDKLALIVFLEFIRGDMRTQFISFM